ncbi:hypothetical protein [Bradyrhizobium sp. 145]|uniref:glycoside hydrolase family protein n=1 Tax=Bradyrhizobium sp. 145 TaxID=2782621 RepID=UPI001FF85B33|nr:hypothetical protein [Bradyrhizobium sp. 145]MCK1685631.1 hypothetical protein [Bradyrhizobium sp. 145]
MPRVPEYQPSVELRPEFRQDVDVRATPESFGADIGKGLEALGKGGESLADSFAKVQALEDETIVRQARNGYLREKDALQYDPEKGYLQKAGQTAMDAFPQYLSDLDTVRKDTASKLTPQQRRMFDRVVDPLDADARRTGLIHKGNALKSFVVEEAQSGAESFKNQALLHYQDAALWQKYTAAGQIEVRALGDKLGWSPEKRKEEEQKFVSDTVKQTALRIAQSDPLAAEKYMKDKADHLTAADTYSLEQGLKVPLKEAQSQRAASDFIAGRTSATPTDAFMADPSPAGLMDRGNIDLTKRPRVQNGKDISTVRSASFDFGDGKETLIPTVSDDGKLLSNDEAVAQFKKTGKHLGKFETPDQASAYAKTLHEQQEQMYAGKAPAASPGRPIASAYDMISRFEGFKTAPYWDVNHLRVGFGSDTITREDGSVAEVKPGMTVTQADATRDLQRRIVSTQGKIAGTVGQDKWDGLSAPAKAAVSSVAYNYGTLPQSVTDAIRTGGPAEIANAIRGLQDQNDGVNKKRRNQEADAVLGINMTAAGRDTQSFFTDMESYLSTIKDPQVQELTRKRINAMLETQHKAQEANERQAKATLWQYIDQGKTPDQIPMEVRQAAGMAAVSSAWSYMDTVQKGREIKSDEEMLYGMRKAAAQDPEFFSKIDLNDYRHVLSRADIKELTGLQTSALADQRKAREAGLELTSAFSQAEQQLAAVGISTAGKKGSQLDEANKRVAQFNNALSAQMDEFKRANNKAPTQPEIQSMINRLLLPVVVKTPGTLWGSNTWAPPGASGGLFGSTKTFAFDAASRPDNATVDVGVKYADIPIDLRRGIAGDLERELGRKPSDWEVVHRYDDFVLNRGLTPIRPPDHGPVDRTARTVADGVAQVVVGLPARVIVGAMDLFKDSGDRNDTDPR